MGTCDLCKIFNICCKSTPAQTDNNNNINNDNNQNLISEEEDKIKINDINDKFIQKEKNIKKQKFDDKPISKDNKNKPLHKENDKKKITVNFRKKFGVTKYTIECDDSEIFSSVEKQLFKKHPYLKGVGMNESNLKMEKVLNDIAKTFQIIQMMPDWNLFIGNNHICFYSHGIKVDKSKTLKENNIEDEDDIFFEYLDFNQINVNFVLDDPEINYKIPCYDIYLFSTIEQKLYNEYPELKEKHLLFQIEGNIINKSLTLEENNIKNNAIISMKFGEKIKVNFISIDQKTKCSITCFDSDIFCDIEQQLYEIAPELQKEYYFLCNGGVIDKSLTFAQNKIKNNSIILINENETSIKEAMNMLEDLEKELGSLFLFDEEIGTNQLISLNYLSTDRSIKCSISCNPKDKFSTVEEKLFLKYPELKEGNKAKFIFNGDVLDSSKTIEENKLKEGPKIMILKI